MGCPSRTTLACNHCRPSACACSVKRGAKGVVPASYQSFTKAVGALPPPPKPLPVPAAGAVPPQ